MTTVRVRNLTKCFGDTAVLDALSIDIPAGDRIALVGANGAGKTTLVRCLLGEYIHEGEISIDGFEPRADRSEVLSRVGFVPQLPPPLRMSARHLVEFTARIAGCDPARIDATALRLGLDVRGLAGRPFVKLSGGQKQKLLIACALGRPCDLLFLDEPAANLDPDARSAFFELLSERIGQATMLISSHRLDEVAPLVGRVVELDFGKIVLDDRVTDAGTLTSRLRCVVELTRPDEACRNALVEWKLSGDEAGLLFAGEIAGPDRLRFLGTASRYSGVIRRLEIETKEPR
ncbi:MAG: ABC transporter ATP-binding protein [bacterium]|nr:ABC transporter ATP-binding protein [bacterium]